MSDITILPLDLKGTLSSNRRVNEEHTLTRVTGRTNRMFAPKFGAYYKESLDIRTVSGKKLIYDTDYVCTYYYDDIWDLNAKECCAIIVIKNPDIGDTLRITYQALGGPYALNIDELKDILSEVDSKPENLGWDDIRNKPLQLPPELHYHEYWQLYGLESTVINLELLGDAWVVGRKGIISDNRFYYEGYIDLAQKALDDYTVKVMAHITDRNNPHLTDKVKVGLDLLNNWAIANSAESVSRTVNNKYQSIGGVYDQIEAHVIPVFDDHLRRQDNPHNVKLSDPLLNLYSTQEIQTLIDTRLKRTEVAFDSNAFQGISLTDIYNNFRTGLPASSLLANSLIPQNRIAPTVTGWVPEDYVLTGAQQYVPYSDLMKAYNDTQGSVYFIGATSPKSYDYFSDGTFAIQGIRTDYNDNRFMMRLRIWTRCRSSTTGPYPGWVQLS